MAISGRSVRPENGVTAAGDRRLMTETNQRSLRPIGGQMIGEKSESDKTRADRWRRRIEKLKRQTEKEPSTEESEGADSKLPESPREFIRRRMKELDSKSESD